MPVWCNAGLNTYSSSAMHFCLSMPHLCFLSSPEAGEGGALPLDKLTCKRVQQTSLQNSNFIMQLV